MNSQDTQGTSPNPGKHLRYSLLENAIDFVSRSVRSTKQDDPAEWKYAILHLAAGIELLLKARLAKEHWSLVAHDVNTITQKELLNGNSRTVGYEAALKRIRNVAGIQIDEQLFGSLNELRKIRNKIQHFGVVLEMEEVKSVMAKGLNFVIEFSESEMNPNNMYTREIEYMSGQLTEFEEFVEERLCRIRPGLKKARLLIDCWRCLQETLEIDPYNLSGDCHFCSYREYDVRYYLPSHIFQQDCPNCGEEAGSINIPYKHSSESTKYIWHCYSCDTAGRSISRPISPEELQERLTDAPSTNLDDH